MFKTDSKAGGYKSSIGTPKYISERKFSWSQSSFSARHSNLNE